MIPIPGIVNLDHEVVFTLEWYYNTSPQPYTHIFLARTATHLLNFAPKWKLAWQKIVLLLWNTICASHLRLH